MHLREAATRGREAVTCSQESPGSMDYDDDDDFDSETKGEKPSPSLSLPTVVSSDQVDPLPPPPQKPFSLC